MHIAIGNDHAGIERKKAILDTLQSKGHTFVDCGTNSSESCDYPDYAHKVCVAVQDESAELGILICGTGIGMSIAANKYVQHLYKISIAPKRHANTTIAIFFAWERVSSIHKQR